MTNSLKIGAWPSIIPALNDVRPSCTTCSAGGTAVLSNGGILSPTCDSPRTLFSRWLAHTPIREEDIIGYLCHYTPIHSPIKISEKEISGPEGEYLPHWCSILGYPWATVSYLVVPNFPVISCVLFKILLRSPALLCYTSPLLLPLFFPFTKLF